MPAQDLLQQLHILPACAGLRAGGALQVGSPLGRAEGQNPPALLPTLGSAQLRVPAHVARAGPAPTNPSLGLLSVCLSPAWISPGSSPNQVKHQLLAFLNLMRFPINFWTFSIPLGWPYLSGVLLLSQPGVPCRSAEGACVTDEDIR